VNLFNLSALKLAGVKAGNIIAGDHKLYVKFLRHLSRRVKRDVITKNMIFLTALSAYTDNPINLFLRGESSIGKSYNVTQTLKYFPRQDVWLLGGLSPTALIHMHGVLVDENGEPIIEVPKPGKDASAEQREAYEAYKAKLKNACSLIDLQCKILVFLEAPHVETFNMLRPILSHDTWELSYKFTDKTGKGSLRTQHVILRGWPATIFCSSNEKYIQDLATRSFTITPEMSEQKYRVANVVSGVREANPWASEQDFDYFLLQSYISFLKENSKVKVVNPYAPVFAEAFPAKSPRSMRDFPHVLSLMKVYAFFHLYQRPAVKIKIKRNGEEHVEQCILVTAKDYDFILALWGNIHEQTETSATANILRFYHNVAVPLTEEKGEWSAADAVEKWNGMFEDKKSDRTIRSWLNFLQSVGYVTSWPDPERRSRNLYKAIKKPANFGNFEISHIFKAEILKNWFNELKQFWQKQTLPSLDGDDVEFEIFENMTSNVTLTVDQLYQKYYRDGIGHFCQNYLRQNQPSLPEKGQEIRRNEFLPKSAGERQCERCSSRAFTVIVREDGEHWLCGKCLQEWEGNL